MPEETKKCALILSGGSIKGAFQTGAILEVLKAGFAPDAIYGISVGSVNGAFLANLRGRDQSSEPDWAAYGQQLYDFWKDRVTGPKKIAKQRNWLAIAWAVLRKKFKGLTDTKPLYQLVHEVTDENTLKNSPVDFYVGCVNLQNGRLNVSHNKSSADFIANVIASTAIPIVMPYYDLKGSCLTDGGVRDVALVGRAIRDGHRKLICIVCQPQEVEPRLDFNPGDAMQFAHRLMDIIVNETINNDIAKVQKVDDLARSVGTPIPDGIHKGKILIDPIIIRPDHEPPIDLNNFTTKNVVDVMEIGRQKAREVLGQSDLSN